MYTRSRNHHPFFQLNFFNQRRGRMGKIRGTSRKSSVVVLSILIIWSIIISNFVLAAELGLGLDDSNVTRSSQIALISPNSPQKISARVADNDNNPANATLISDATFINKSKLGNLSGDAAAGDDFVDYFKIYLDSKAEVDGINADKLKIWINTTATFNITMSIFDPDMHLLAKSETAAAFNNGSVWFFAIYTGMHYIKIELDPSFGYAEYNLTYQLLTETNVLLDKNNDFSNGTGTVLTITDMGSWEKKEFDPGQTQQIPLNQNQDIHDFFNITINASENISISLTVPDGNTYGAELFNGSNSSQLLAYGRFAGGAQAGNNKPVYFDIERTGNYSLRVYTVYEDPNLLGGSGEYLLYVLIKPQNDPPIVRTGAPDTLNLKEDQPPNFLNLNDTIFFDPNIQNTNDNLSFFILNGTTWDTSYLSSNLSVNILPNGTASIRPLKDINTTGENLTFRAVDWLGWNITHNVTVVVTPENDAPILVFVKVGSIELPVTSQYMNLSNDQGLNLGAWEDQPYNFSVKAFDIDGDELEFLHDSTVIFKKSMGFNDPNIMNYTFTPTQAMVGIVQITIRVNETEDNLAPGDMIVVNISVNNTNDPPIITSVNGNPVTPGVTIEFLGAQGVFADYYFNFSVSADDIDLGYGDILTFNTTNVSFLQRGILKLTKIDEKSVNVSFKPEQLDIGIRFINITVEDSESFMSYVNLKIEIKEPETKYTLTDADCDKTYNDAESNDDYTFYELVYNRPGSPVSYRMIAHTAKGKMPGVDIYRLFSRKAGDYFNISVIMEDDITENTVIKIFVVEPFKHYETELDNTTKELPDPYIPAVSDYVFSLSYGDVLEPDTGNPILLAPNILEFSIHLGILENTYGITHGVEFGLFAQAYKSGSNEFDYFSYDSIGVGSVKAPDVISNLLTYEECDIRETDQDSDDVYGYIIKFKEQDRSAGLTLERTERGGHPEIDFISLTSFRDNLYFEVTLTFATKISNDSLVNYNVYIVSYNHSETGVHLTPSKVTNNNYPIPYIPPPEIYYRLGKYNNGTTMMADKVVIDNNKIIFSFHLGLLQHQELGNITTNSNFGIFATAVRELNTTSILDYGFYYDSIGLGSKSAPTDIITSEKKEKDEDVPLLFILGHIGGIPILIIIIIAIIVICLIASYAAYVKSKYGKALDVDVPAVPAVPSTRGGGAPDYGIYPGRARDELYYEDLYEEELEAPTPAYDQYEYGPEPTEQLPIDEGEYDVIPEEEEDLVEPELAEEPPLEEPVEELPEEEIPKEDLTEEELEAMVPSEEPVSEEEEPELGEVHLPDEDMEIEDIEVEEKGEAEAIEEGAEEEEMEEGEEEEEEFEEFEPVSEEEPVEEEEPVSEEEPLEEEAEEEFEEEDEDESGEEEAAEDEEEFEEEDEAEEEDEEFEEE